MEKFKLDRYKIEMGEFFPRIESLSIENQSEILNEIINLIGFSFVAEELFIELTKKLPNKDFDDEFTYDIKSIFKEFMLSSEGDTIIIWNKDEMDKVNTKVLLDKWNYIWYGDSDEAIILFQKENKKLLVITHFGRISYN